VIGGAAAHLDLRVVGSEAWRFHVNLRVASRQPDEHRLAAIVRRDVDRAGAGRRDTHRGVDDRGTRLVDDDDAQRTSGLRVRRRWQR
jgi:hypothetical protein